MTSHQPEKQGTPASQTWFTKAFRLFRRNAGNGLFAYTVYAFIFVALFNSGTNCLQFGRQFLIGKSPNPDKEVDDDLVRLIAIIVLWAVCTLHFSSARAGRNINTFFAITKVLVLVILACRGSKKAAKGEMIGNLGPELIQGRSRYATALLLVIFSFEGWENANFVSTP
jgi:amino acid transporter